MPDVDHSPRAFEDSVKIILTTFGVFTGFAIKSAIDAIQFPTSASWDAFLDIFKDSHFFVCIATIALLLRFIVGSAIHLNLCYVVEPRSKMSVMLFKDLAFLIVFGLLAIFMIKAGDDVPAFATRSLLFVLVGSIWSLLDLIARARQTAAGEKSLFSVWWLLIDLAQLGAILLIYNKIDDTWWQAFWLAGAFAVALYLDMWVVLGAKKTDGASASA